MQQPDGFVLGKYLVSNTRNQIYAAVRESDGRSVVLKAATSPVHQEHLRREFEALCKVQGEGVVQALDLLEDGAPVLVLAHVPGLSLAASVRASMLGLDAFLEMGVRISDALAHVHSRHWIHCDVTPGNVMVDPVKRTACLIDFGLAQPLGATSRALEVASLTGTLPYIAPEQTGRMNRGMDWRSDLYSLGATFYFALTGAPPFESSDALALIHAHMARTPRPPHELRRDLPLALSRLVLKLLEKEPEARYQSASALAADLRICREQWAREGRVANTLALGSAEAQDRPRFAPRLYGRDSEFALLHALFERARAGCMQLVILAGEPGTGKSALVEQLRTELVQSSGYLVVGKFDLSRDRPYSAWIHALGAFARQLLMESDARLARWREVLREALGNIGRVLVEFVPDLQFVLGEMPSVPALGPRETQARLALALQRFMGACAAADHPLVLFLDDLHWSDVASRELLEDLVLSEAGHALLIVGAYRSSEVSEGHPLMRCFERFAERKVAMQVVTLGPLSTEATAAMLADALNRSHTDVRPLAELIERKTGNAPLLVRQFIEHLYDHRLLHYERGSGWQWDAATVAAADIPEGAVPLMRAKLHRLDAMARVVIELAGCVGDQFDAELLCQLSPIERTSLEEGLYALSREGLIVPHPSGFRFVHDRIREAARQLLSESARARLHHDIAQLLLARIPENEQPARVFEIAEHLSGGLAYLSEEQRLPAVRINVAAGKRALASGAASTAEHFLQVGRRLLRDEDWARELVLGYELMLLSIESAFLRGEFESALALIDKLTQKPISQLQRAQLEARRIQVFAVTRTPQESARYVLGVLRKLGVRWPSRPSHLLVYAVLRVVLWRLRGAGLQAALRPARAPDPARVAPFIVLSSAAAVFGRSDAYLTALVAAWAASLNLRRGYISRPAFTLTGLAGYQQGIVGDTAASERIEAAALAWQAQSPDPVYGPRSDLTVHGNLRPWRMARRRALAPLERVAEQLQEVGDLEHACYSRFLKALYEGLAGDPLSQVLQALHEISATVSRNRLVYREPELCRRPLQWLAAADPSALEAEIASSEAEIATCASAEVFVRTAWLMALCVHGHFELALAQSEAAFARLFRVTPFVHIVDHTLYRGLAAAVLTGAARGARQWRYHRMFQQSLRRMQRWAKTGPDFVHMALLLEAERMRLAGDTRRARSLYERSALRARQQDFGNCAGLAHERLARMLLDLHRRTEASAAFAHAIALYRQWGAQSKAARLETESQALR